MSRMNDSTAPCGHHRDRNLHMSTRIDFSRSVVRQQFGALKKFPHLQVLDCLFLKPKPSSGWSRRQSPSTQLTTWHIRPNQAFPYSLIRWKSRPHIVYIDCGRANNVGSQSKTKNAHHATVRLVSCAWNTYSIIKRKPQAMLFYVRHLQPTVNFERMLHIVQTSQLDDQEDRARGVAEIACKLIAAPTGGGEIRVTRFEKSRADV
jgi:hypothetical protein